MKRFLQLIIGALVVGMLCLTLSHWFKSKEQVHTNQKIYVYNWGEYIDPELIKKFEKKLAFKSFMKLSIQMKRWKPKFAMAVHIMMLLFLVNIQFKN